MQKTASERFAFVLVGIAATVSSWLILAKRAAADPPVKSIAQLADPDTSDDEFLSLIHKLRSAKPSSEEAKLLADIANSERMSAERRALAWLQLVDRHVHPGLTLSETSKILRSCDWLKSDNCRRVVQAGGSFPVTLMSDKDSLIVIGKLPVDPSVAVYLIVDADMSVDQFLRAIKGDNNNVAGAKIKEIVVCSPRPQDRGLYNYQPKR